MAMLGGVYDAQLCERVEAMKLVSDVGCSCFVFVFRREDVVDVSVKKLKPQNVFI